MNAASILVSSGADAYMLPSIALSWILLLSYPGLVNQTTAIQFHTMKTVVSKQS